MFGGGATCNTNHITRAPFDTNLASLILGFVLEISCSYLWQTYRLIMFIIDELYFASRKKKKRLKGEFCLNA